MTCFTTKVRPTGVSARQPCWNIRCGRLSDVTRWQRSSCANRQAPSRIHARRVRMGADGRAYRDPGHQQAQPVVSRRSTRGGWEQIEITQRLVCAVRFGMGPFRALCLGMGGGTTLVGNRDARSGIGPEIPSHLWWRGGPICYTMSGPVSQAWSSWRSPSRCRKSRRRRHDGADDGSG